MSALNSTVLRSGSAKRSSGEQRLSGLHRGEVVNLNGGLSYFILPRITGTQVHGPYPYLPAGLEVGSKVLVGAIDGRMDDLIILHLL